MCNRMVQNLPTTFLFPIIVSYCKVYKLSSNNGPREKGQINPKRGWQKAHIQKHVVMLKNPVGQAQWLRLEVGRSLSLWLLRGL